MKIDNPLTERADSSSINPYPNWWGAPPGTRASESRAEWVLSNTATDDELRNRGLDPREVRAS